MRTVISFSVIIIFIIFIIIVIIFVITSHYLLTIFINKNLLFNIKEYIN